MKKIIKLTESDLTDIINKILNESDPKVGTGKKPKGSDRRLYTDENPNDTVSVKFKTKEDIVNTLNKDSFKAKPHNRQSQIINLIHQRVRAAYQNAKDPETKKRLKRGLDYIEVKKENSKEKTVRLQKEGLNNTTNKVGQNKWKDINGKLIRVYKFPTYSDTIDFVNMVSDVAEKQQHHPEMIVGYDTVKVIIFDHEEGGISDKCYKFTDAVDKVMGNEQIKGEQTEGELTEKCWAGYTQKGMKTMFGKRYPNCVKKTKK